MNAPAKLAGFAAALGLLFGGGALAGAVVDPDRDEPREEGHAAAEKPREEGHAAAEKPREGAHGEGREAAGSGGHSADPVRGLGVAANGLRLVVADPDFAPGREGALRFRIVDDRGATVRDFDVEHEKRMHLIVARRDLSTFQHVHPRQERDGSWSVPLTLRDAGSYRVFADFSHEEKASTLASDLRVDGAADLKPLPRPATTATSDGGLDVELHRDGGHLEFAITDGGKPVETEPYLGAGGHLVVLREGDLAFLHVHPEDDGVRFETELPTAGRYRLFLQFKHEGRVHTVAFTEEKAR